MYVYLPNLFGRYRLDTCISSKHLKVLGGLVPARSRSAECPLYQLQKKTVKITNKNGTALPYRSWQKLDVDQKYLKRKWTGLDAGQHMKNTYVRQQIENRSIL